MRGACERARSSAGRSLQLLDGKDELLLESVVRVVSGCDKKHPARHSFTERKLDHAGANALSVTPMNLDTRIGTSARCSSATACCSRLSAMVIRARRRTYSAHDAMT